VTILLILSMLLIPMIILLIGLIWQKHPPRTINYAYGYRTRRSTASQQAWDFAHARFSKYALWYGAAMLTVTAAAIVISLAVAAFDGLKTAATYCLLVQVAALGLPIALVERELSRKFDGEGRKGD